MKHLMLLSLLITSCSFSPGKPHRTAQEIYQSGIIGDTTDFYLFNKDDLKVRDHYRYKYDTSLVLQKDYFGERASVHIIAFYYKKMAEGKWIVYDEEGKISSETHFRNGKENGDAIAYREDGSKNKIYYKDGEPVYEVNYDEAGKMVDSVNVTQ